MLEKRRRGVFAVADMTRFHCFAAVLCISLGLFVSGMAQTTGANFTDEDLEDFANATDLNMTGSDDGEFSIKPYIFK